jgi:hypothetical protein
MKILVCGGRNFKNKELMEDVLRQWDIREIVHGDARGADTLAGDYARSNGIIEKRYPADWRAYGRRAGYVRNTEMLNEGPDLVVAFPGGKGTAMMVDIAKKANIGVYEVGLHRN